MIPFALDMIRGQHSLLPWVLAFSISYYFLLLRFDVSASTYLIRNHTTKNNGTNNAVSANGIQTKAASKKATTVSMMAPKVLIVSPLCLAV